MNYSPLLFLCYTVRLHGRNCMLFPYNPSTLKISAWDIVGTQKKKKNINYWFQIFQTNFWTKCLGHNYLVLYSLIIALFIDSFLLLGYLKKKKKAKPRNLCWGWSPADRCIRSSTHSCFPFNRHALLLCLIRGQSSFTEPCLSGLVYLYNFHTFKEVASFLHESEGKVRNKRR